MGFVVYSLIYAPDAFVQNTDGREIVTQPCEGDVN